MLDGPCRDTIYALAADPTPHPRCQRTGGAVRARQRSRGRREDVS
jgi:hypothetical protein